MTLCKNFPANHWKKMLFCFTIQQLSFASVFLIWVWPLEFLIDPDSSLSNSVIYSGSSVFPPCIGNTWLTYETFQFRYFIGLSHTQLITLKELIYSSSQIEEYKPLLVAVTWPSSIPLHYLPWKTAHKHQSVYGAQC